MIKWLDTNLDPVEQSLLDWLPKSQAMPDSKNWRSSVLGIDGWKRVTFHRNTIRTFAKQARVTIKSANTAYIALRKKEMIKGTKSV